MTPDCKAWTQSGFEDFSRGRFDDGGANLYVNANGVIETVYRTDLNNDGYPDLVLANTHGYIERAPTLIYKRDGKSDGGWRKEELPHDSGWMSRIVDVDGDGYPDLIVVNGENGVTSELDSYVYWGGPNGLTGDRTDLATAGAYDVAALDLEGSRLKDLIFGTAWVDHHNPGQPMAMRAFRQIRPRQFEDVTEEYGLIGCATTSLAAADLTGNGFPDLVLSNYRKEFEYETDSFVYRGTADGFDTESPLRLPGHYSLYVRLADLNGDGRDEIILSGGDQVRIYWNRDGEFDANDRTIIESVGFTTMFCQGALHCDVADVDGDGRNELLVATMKGIEIRSPDALHEVSPLLPLEYASWVHAADLDGDGRPEIVASRYENGVTYETNSAIFWNSANGFSQDRVTLLPTAGAMGTTAGDLDGDGRPEVIFTNTLLGPAQDWPGLPAYVYLSKDGPEYGADHRLELPTSGGYGSAVADLNLDGYADIVLLSGSHTLRVFPGGPDGPRADHSLDLQHPASGTQSCIMAVHAADFYRDGFLDLLALALTYDDRPETMAASSIIFFGSADGFSQDRSQIVPTYCGGNGVVGDFNRNGYLDIIVGDKRGHLTIFLGGPEGFSAERTRKVIMNVPTTGHINAADLTRNGWLDLVIGVGSHYRRAQESIIVLYGGPDGYAIENSQTYAGGFSPGNTGIGDFNNDGYLEIAVPGYSSATDRVLPVQIFGGDGGGAGPVSFDMPLQQLPAEAPSAVTPVDLNLNGWTDLVVTCHRDNIGHQVDSLIYWNGPEGFSPERATRLPGLGPHRAGARDFGNAYTREPLERYISAPCDLQGRKPTRINWDADVPEPTELTFQLRWAGSEAGLEKARWCGPDGEGTSYRDSGQAIRDVPASAEWLQYRATFLHRNGARSPQLKEVRIDHA